MSDSVKYIHSPVGYLKVTATSKAITGIHFSKTKSKDSKEIPAVLKKAEKELQEYFKGKRKSFDLPLEFDGTEFQKNVWKALSTIPFGQTVSYKDIAIQVGSPKACRAVGLANNKNPISIVVPCHRVIGSSGKLVGYGGGLSNKQKLLDLEQE